VAIGRTESLHHSLQDPGQWVCALSNPIIFMVKILWRALTH
jgi:hypothetical protein